MDVKVLVLNFDPVVAAGTRQRIHEVCRWNDPKKLAEGYAADVLASSGGFIRYRVYPAAKEILDWHRRGTHYGIGVDAADGLLRAGGAGTQLTWMDAKVGDWVVTPRDGKPVEINALWYNALRMAASWARAVRAAPSTSFNPGVSTSTTCDRAIPGTP